MAYNFSDPIMQQLAQRVTDAFGELPPISPLAPSRYFRDLAESIIGQQLSGKVAPIITRRVVTAVGTDFTPTAVLKTDFGALRQAGLSNAKARYICNLAEAWLSVPFLQTDFTHQDDETIIAELTKIKGIGRWTVEMFLIFGLGRPDVFSAGDYGLRRALLNAYQLPESAKPKELIQRAEQWLPHRSLASRILWKSLELK
jgi:DNA-3-methyladenine glycosylase II